jgi:SAM-dependent methyltransferase
MDRFIAYYDRPGHYMRVTVLFGKPFWREQIRDSWFMLDAFGGCCVYDESARHDAGQYGVLSWLIAGTDALSLSNFDDQTIEGLVLDSLPDGLRDAAIALSMEARVHRWMASINGQPGGIPVRDTRSAHLPEPAGHPALFTVGDYVFDSTINGVLDSADFATDFFQSWRLTRDLLASAASRPSGLDKSYFDRYHHNMSYEDSYDWYFDAKYVRDFIRIVWKARPPYRLLDAGSANGLTLKDFADYGIKAWGVENNKYIHRRTKAKWRKRNLLGDIRKLPFPDGNFDFVYETCLAHLEPDQLGPAIREIHRVCRRGVIFGSLTSDMNPELFRGRDLLMGIKALMPLWEWGELFTANGFAIAATDEATLDKLWRGEEKYNEGDDPWYPDRESLRYCFYTRLPVWPARRKKV